MVKVERLYIVDGIDTGISAEGSSAKEALALITAAAEEIGAAPKNGAMTTAASAAAAQQRTRRTKEQIAADEARAKNQPQPSLPPGVQHAFPGPGAQGQPFTPPPTLPQGAQLRHDVPPVNPHASGVAVSGPPAPSFAPPPSFSAPMQVSTEQIARDEARAAVDRLMGSIPDVWRDSISATVQGFVAKHGGVPVEVMSEANARAFLDDVQRFQTTCDNAPR